MDAQRADAAPVLDGGSAIQVLASNRGAIGDLVLCGSDVVWSELDNHAIVHVSVNGGDPISLVTTRANALFCDGIDVYWVDSVNTVMSIPVAGGDPTIVAELQNGAKRVFVQNSVAYWTTAPGEIRRKRLPDGDVETIATMQGSPFAMTSSLGLLYWGSAGQSEVKSLPLDAPSMPLESPVIVASDQSTPFAMDSADSVIYWVNANDGRVQSLANDGLGIVDLSGGKSSGPVGLAVSQKNVFWTNECVSCSPGTDYLLRTAVAHRTDPVHQGAVEVFASGETQIGPVRVGGAFVVWTSMDNGGSVFRRAE